MKRLLLGILALSLCFSFTGPSRAGASAPLPPIPSVCGPMDIVFVIDDTGSMGVAIANVKAGLADLITTAQTASGGNLRMGLVTFKDSVTVRLPLTDSGSDASAITAAVSALIASEGNGWAEASDQAIKYVAGASTACLTSGLPLGAFRPEAIKIAVLVTDAAPGGCDDNYVIGVDDVSAHAAAEAAAAANILISSIYVFSGVLPDIEAIMAYYASTTGGVYTKDETFGELVAVAMDEIIAKCGLSSNKCPRSQGYWKTHPEAWPADAEGTPLPLLIDGTSYTQDALLAVLAMPVKGNAVLILAKQLIAAKLNILNGSNPAVINLAITNADLLMNGVVLGTTVIRTNTAMGHEMTMWAAELDQYNNRLLTPDCEDDEED